jgi:hypothetical protein
MLLDLLCALPLLLLAYAGMRLFGFLTSPDTSHLTTGSDEYGTVYEGSEMSAEEWEWLESVIRLERK